MKFVKAAYARPQDKQVYVLKIGGTSFEGKNIWKKVAKPSTFAR